MTNLNRRIRDKIVCSRLIIHGNLNQIKHDFSDTILMHKLLNEHRSDMYKFSHTVNFDIE